MNARIAFRPTDTGLVTADLGGAIKFTYFKLVSNANDEPQTGITLTELGLGVYRLHRADGAAIDFRCYLDAAPTIYYDGVLQIAQTGDAYAVVNHADHGNAKLVRSTTPANTLTVDANHLVAVPDTQKVDVETIKTVAVTATATVAFQNGTIPITTDIPAAAPAASAIADAVWDEVVTTGAHDTATFAGKALLDAGGAGTPLTAQEVRDAMKLDATAGAPAAGSVDAHLDSIITDIADIPTGDENADALLARNVSGGSSTGRTVKQALHFLRNKWSISGATLTVTDIDDSTPSWTATVGTDAAAVPIVSNDPS